MTDETNTTPGPWHIDTDGWVVSEAEDFAICLIDGSRRLDEFDPIDRANANLIIAAPDLLEALKAAVSQVHLTNSTEPMSPNVKMVFDQCCDAIAKAEGRSK